MLPGILTYQIKANGINFKQMLINNIKHDVKTVAIWVLGNPLCQTLANNYRKNNVIFLAYHGISSDAEQQEAWTLVRENRFHQQMQYIKSNFDCIAIDEFPHRTIRKSKRPGVVVTFDDGYANNLEIALPILEDLNIPAIVYITTQPMLERELFWPDKIWMAAKCSQLESIDLRDVASPLGIYHFHYTANHWQDNILNLLEDIKKTNPYQRSEIVQTIVTMFKTAPGAKNFHLTAENNVFSPLTTDQLKQLSSHPLITIGSHSHCHNILDQIPFEQARNSIMESKKILEEITDVPIRHFAYPNGNFNPSLMKIVQDLNFSSAVTIRHGFYKKGDNPFTINRFCIGSDTSIDLFKALLTGIFELNKIF